ncbi:MAG: hypothetical protein U0Q18_22920 [Bryobacteraceae bacterium]
MGGLRLMTTQWLAVSVSALMLHAAASGPKIEVVEGDGAINNIRLHRAKEPVVKVVDQDGHPLAKVPVTFVLPAQGPGGSFADGRNTLTVMTDNSGQAVGRGLRPNNSAGQFQIRVSASYEGHAIAANLTQTNAQPAGGGESSKTLLILALIGGAGAVGAAVGLKGKSSSSGGSTQTGGSGAVISPGSPSFGPPK